MAAVRDVVQSTDAERRFLLTEVPWTTYVQLRHALDTARVHMTYLWHSTSRNFAVHPLVGERHAAVTSSQLRPRLDLSALASFVRSGENHTALVKSYRVAVRG